MDKKYVLGIESTAHTFGVAIVEFETGKILSNLKDIFTTEQGGLIPPEVAKHHREISGKLYSEALKKAEACEENICAIAFSNAPGLAPCLIEGMRFAKELGKKLNVPLIPVNHCIAHLEIGETTGAKDPLLLYASGANTQIIAYESGKYRIFGETLDIGIGNFIDKFARSAGLGFPGGPKIEKLALESKNYIELPYAIKGMDMAFSGILTKSTNMLEEKDEKGSKKYKIEDLCFSIQETVFAMLVEAAERALAHTGKKELLLGGGVACNARLQEMCRKMCEERKDKVKFFCPEKSLLVDNAGMIGYLGLKMFKKGIFEKPEHFSKIDIQPRQRTDEVSVSWK